MIYITRSPEPLRNSGDGIGELSFISSKQWLFAGKKQDLVANPGV